MNAVARTTSLPPRTSSSAVEAVTLAPDQIATWIRNVVTQPDVFDTYNEVIAALVDSGPLQAAIKLTISVAARSIKRVCKHASRPGERAFHYKAA